MFFLIYLLVLFNLIFYFFSFNLHQLFLLQGLFYIDSSKIHVVDIIPISDSFSILFFFLISLVVTSAYCVLSFKKLMNSLIHLILIFMIMALLLLLLNFDFLAVLTLLIYVGAIMVFFLFAILLLLKFFSFKFMTVSKHKLFSFTDSFLLFYLFFVLIVFFYSIGISYSFYDSCLLVSTNGFFDKISFIINNQESSNNTFINWFSFSNQNSYKEFVNFSCSELVLFNSLVKDIYLSKLSLNLAQLDLIHVYGLQLYISYSFLLVSAGVLLSIVIYAALKISKPFRSVLLTKYIYK